MHRVATAAAAAGAASAPEVEAAEVATVDLAVARRDAVVAIVDSAPRGADGANTVSITMDSFPR